MQRAYVIHRRCADDHERADDESAVHVRQRQSQIGLQTLAGLLMKSQDLELFTPKRVHHSNRTEPFLRLREHGAFLFLNEGRLAANAAREKINRAHNEWNNREGKQRQLPVQSHHEGPEADGVPSPNVT